MLKGIENLETKRFYNKFGQFRSVQGVARL